MSFSSDPYISGVFHVSCNLNGSWADVGRFSVDRTSKQAAEETAYHLEAKRAKFKKIFPPWFSRNVKDDRVLVEESFVAYGPL